MMSTDKNAIALFVKVVEIGSFSKAAAREAVPISTLSRKVAELEKNLGVRLLERSTRQLRLTDVGKDYFDRCRRGLAELEAAESAITDRHADITGRLRISIPPSMSDVVLLPLVREFQQKYPGVSLHCQVTERYIDPIADGIDLSLRVGHPKDSSLVATTLTIHRPRLISSPEYLASIGNLNFPEDIIPWVKIAFSRWEKPIRWTLIGDGASRVINLDPPLVLNDYAAVVKGVIEGHGISEAPTFLCQQGFAEGSLVEVLPAWRFEAVKVTATYPSRYLAPHVRAFRDYCITYFQQNPLA